MENKNNKSNSCCDTNCCTEDELNSETTEYFSDDKIKEIVKAKYTNIAIKSEKAEKIGCCNDDKIYSIMNDEYINKDGYNPEADLHLGCGIPTEHAKINEGDIVVDLGSGAGNDCFVVRAITKESGKVIGIDFSEAMIKKAKSNAEKLGYKNIEFILGDIENIPIEDNAADAVISNCVLNLVPNKSKVFSEIYRILKSGGHFSISDIVLTAPLPDKLRNAASLYAGCVSGAVLKDEYLSVIKKAGFKNIQVQAEKKIIIPMDFYKNYLNNEEIKGLDLNNSNIYSITVYAEK